MTVLEFCQSRETTRWSREDTLFIAKQVAMIEATAMGLANRRFEEGREQGQHETAKVDGA